jgi:hypothetical protein
MTYYQRKGIIQQISAAASAINEAATATLCKTNSHKTYQFSATYLKRNINILRRTGNVCFEKK